MQYCVLITDISHFTAQAVTVGLLQQGYRVVGIVEQEAFIEPSKQLLSNHLDDLSNLTIHCLQDQETVSKESLLSHCDIVFHMMPPAPILNEDGRIKWIRMLHHETIQWLEASKKQHILKFVVTTSILSLRYNMADPTVHLIDGQFFSQPKWETLSPFATQVVKSDLANWAYIRKNKLDNIFTTIYVSSVFGHCNHFTTTPFIRLIEKMIDGQYFFLPKFQWPAIDVDDIVKTHLNIIDNDLLSNKRLILADETISLTTIKEKIIHLRPHLKKNMPRIITTKFLEQFLKQFSPQHKMIVDELGGKIIANSRYTREILQTNFISSEEALTKTLNDILW
ncbi:MAG: NAD-dependent epimerase/dehydratase family protein [Pseudomonadota bacterium]|nr:NAD-dependent epimerase/dehydratase family protein [Pseudomonadota bacterium]